MYTVFVRPSGERVYKKVRLMALKGKGKNVSELKKEIEEENKEDTKGDN